MKRKIQDIGGVGPKHAEPLGKAGKACTDKWLAKGGTPMGRVNIVSATGIYEKRILKWVDMCDLFRVEGWTERASKLDPDVHYGVLS